MAVSGLGILAVTVDENTQQMYSLKDDTAMLNYHQNSWTKADIPIYKNYKIKIIFLIFFNQGVEWEIQLKKTLTLYTAVP